MGITHREQHGFRLRALLQSNQAVLCVLLVVLSPASLFAQRPHMTYKTPAVLVPAMPDDRVVVDKGISQPAGGDNKMCSLQPFPGMASTVSVTSLQIPPKAQKEYDQACAALKSNKMPETEKHLRKATQIYPNYAAGWVMLGQVLDTTQQTAQARVACSRASTADPNYLPAYLCLAEIAGREEKWSEVLNLTSHALDLDAANDAYAYFFSAIAYFNLNQLPEAEKGALKAEEIDKAHNEPMIQFLLSEIYDAKNDPALAAAHLEEYRKIAPGSRNSDSAKKN